jgi:hypothetical protein
VRAVVRTFAADGALKNAEGPVTVAPDRRVEADLGEGEIAVIERVTE